MKYLILVFAAFLAVMPTFGQQVEIVKFSSLQSIIDSKSDKIQVINFWATWCAPCVKELPFFEALRDSSIQGVEVTLVNLDFADKIGKVNSFMVRKQMKSRVILLDEVDYNQWIDKVDKNWSGAIPATLIINGTTGKRKFVEKELEKGDLEKMIQELR